MDQPGKAPRRGLVARRTPAGNREKKLLQQQQGDDQSADTRSVASSSIAATTHVSDRLASLLDAPADGSAFMSLSKKIAQEEKAIAAAPKMRAKRRSRLEIVAEDDDVDGNDAGGDSDDDSDDVDAGDKKKQQQHKKHSIVDIVESTGKAKGKKAAAAAEASASRASTAAADAEGDDDGAKAGLRLLKQAARDQNCNRLLPHQDRPDYEYRLRRIATSGTVRLFNALAQAQTAGNRAAAEMQRIDEEEGLATADKIENRKVAVSRDAFMAALRGAASSKANK